MGMKKAALAGRAWKLLRLALLWARKGGLFRRGLAPGIRLVPGYLSGHRAAAAARSDMIRYEEREFSFDEKPIFHFKMHRPRSMRIPHIPCIKPPAVFEDDDDILFGRDERLSWLSGADTNMNGGEVEEEERRDAVVGGGGEKPCGVCGDTSEGEEEAEEEEEKCIDVTAEEFIAKFYQQMRLQRQVSLLQYNEMLLRSSG